jgi:regulator of replication initiation timing
MTDETLASGPTASGLKKELSDSLETLKKDFENLKHFVEELAPEGIPVPLALTNDDLKDLLSIMSDIQDAASNLEFEADKIKQTLDRFVD